jgi:hypothetical protein
MVQNKVFVEQTLEEAVVKAEEFIEQLYTTSNREMYKISRLRVASKLPTKDDYFTPSSKHELYAAITVQKYSGNFTVLYATYLIYIGIPVSVYRKLKEVKKNDEESTSISRKS